MLSTHARRAPSRSSTATATSTYIDSSPPSSWSDRKRTSNRHTDQWDPALQIETPGTSMGGWSDGETALPSEDKAYSRDDERPLIDLDEDVPSPETGDHESEQDEGRYGEYGERSYQDGRAREEQNGRNMSEKLRALMLKMEADVMDSAPAQPRVYGRQQTHASYQEETREQVVVVPGWRAGRRSGLAKSLSREDQDKTRSSLDQNDSEDEALEDDEEDLDSPPTPPLRVVNPYLSRKTSDRLSSSASTSSRIPSRAAVLRSIGSSQQSESPSTPHPRTPLETFIATHPAPLHYNPIDHSTSRDVSSSISSSRKGKERAAEEDLRTPGPTRTRFASSTSRSPPISRRVAPTPRRRSVELAPDSSAVFAEEAKALEVQGDMELDIDESSLDAPWGEEIEDESQTEDEAPPERDTTPLHHSLRESNSQEVTLGWSTGLRSVLSRSRSHQPSRESPARRSVSAEEESLPALPEPSLDTSDEEDQFETLPSRQASLFRSPSRSISHAQNDLSNQSSVENSSSRKSAVSTSISFQSSKDDRHQSRTTDANRFVTPLKKETGPARPTPHPPGWYTTGKGKTTRFSPSIEEPSVSVHRLKLSPAKTKSKSPTPSPKRATPGREKEEKEAVDEGNSSFLGRIPVLSRLVSVSNNRPYPPKPSTVLVDARETLSQASKRSHAAQTRVESSQRQFLEALAAAQSVSANAVHVARQGWQWTNWAWWLGMELLLIWSVFRVTLDYASSTHHVSMLDPFSIAANSRSLSIPLPNAASSFTVPHRGSANFFDLLENAGLWRTLDQLGLLDSSVGGIGVFVAEGGLRMLGGVPT